MAIKATIFKAQLTISDMDNHRYQDFNVTIARHPSETDQRMMCRLLAFALNANESLEFTKGLCEDDEPELWQKSLTDEIELWVELGLPDEKRLKKACNRAKQVMLYSYGDSAQDIWWQKIANKLHGFDNLSVISLPYEATQAMAELAQRTMQLQVNIQDGQIWLSSDQTSVLIEPEIKK